MSRGVQGHSISLGVCAAVSILLHLAAMPAISTLQRWGTERKVAKATEPERDKTQSQEPQQRRPDPPAKPVVEEATALGKDDAPQRTTVAWIAHEEFQELVARQSRTLQPALQKQVDPVPAAAVRMDATASVPEVTQHQPSPPAQVQPQPQPQPQPVQPVTVPEPAKPQPAEPAELAAVEPASRVVQPVQPPQVVKPMDAVISPEAERVSPPVALAALPPQQRQQEEPSKAKEPEKLVAAQARPQASPPVPAAEAAPPTQAGKTTSAARSDREATPASIVGGALKPGGVLVSQGVEIKTTVPQLSIAARFIVPRNPRVYVLFNADGSVHEAGFVRTEGILRDAGHPSWNAPLLASFYQWRATGREFKKLSQPLRLEINVILIEDASR